MSPTCPDAQSNVPSESLESTTECECECGGKAEPADPRISEPSEPDELRKPGHWLLAKLGKRVLRPGGLELSRRLLAAAAPTSADRVVEFGPGAGKTAEILLAARPAQYAGVELNPDAPQALTDLIAEHPQARIIRADARATGLDEESADLVVGEAMLTMQSMEDKRAIMAEAFRLLAPGGRYAIQELGFRPDDCPQSVMDELSAAISRLTKVGARPLTLQGWCQMLEECGFEVETRLTNPMLLLEPKRVIADEGLLRALRFFVNVRRNPAARTRIRAMRQAFRANQEHLHAVAIVARKPRR